MASAPVLSNNGCLHSNAKEKSIAYWFRQLTGTQNSDTTMETELLSVVCVLEKKNRAMPEELDLIPRYHFYCGDSPASSCGRLRFCVFCPVLDFCIERFLGGHHHHHHHRMDARFFLTPKRVNLTKLGHLRNFIERDDKLIKQ